MCLGVPGQVIEWLQRDPTFGLAVVEFAGVRRQIHMACVPEAGVGDYVVVHAGIAICHVDEAEAARTLAEFARLEQLHTDADSSLQSDSESDGLTS